MKAIGPAVLVVLGAMLGVCAMVSTQADMGLRVPSLFAALLMVAQGLLEIGRAQRQRDRTEVPPPVVSPSGEVALYSRVGYPAPSVGARAGSSRFAIPVTLMLLAIWLALAVLFAGSAAVFLSCLATVAAFLLFALGWQLLLTAR